MSNFTLLIQLSRPASAASKYNPRVRNTIHWYYVNIVMVAVPADLDIIPFENRVSFLLPLW